MINAESKNKGINHDWQMSDMKKLFISFSARRNGSCNQVAEYLASEEDKIVYFRDMDFHNCRNCDYECFSDECKYRHDGIYQLYEEMTAFQKVVFVVPMYCGNPSSLYFVFHERSQDYFMHHEDQYEDIIKRLFIIGIYGDRQQSPDFIPCLEKWFIGSRYSNHVLGIERHKYDLKLQDSILDVEEIREFITEWLNPSKAQTEASAMAVVVCQGKILATNELIYGRETLSLPKGHIEENETPSEAAIRECNEETNISIHENDFIKQLTPFTYEFLTPANTLIRKTLFPFLFEVQTFGNPLPKEERMRSVQWMNAEDFLSLCPYENVKQIVKEAFCSE